MEEYIEARARRDNLVGSDIRELREDLSAHVYEEAEGLKVERIGSVDVEKIIAGLESRSADQVALVTRKKGWSWALVFGVIMPLLVAIIEILSGFCGGVFFDPVPTVWHSLLVLSVPLVNWWLLTKGRAAGAMAQRRARSSRGASRRRIGKDAAPPDRDRGPGSGRGLSLRARTPARW